MGALWQRIVKLTLAVPVDDYGTTSRDLIEVEQLRVSFKVEKSLAKEPNVCTATVTNLAPEQRAAIARKGAKFILEAGYADDGMEQLFIGDVRTAFSKPEAGGWSTEIRSGDGERAFRFARVGESFRSGTPIADVVKTLAKRLGLGTGNLNDYLPTLKGKHANGYVAHGPASRELDKVLSMAGLEWSIQDGALHVRRPDDGGKIVAPDLSPDSGLVGTPEVATAEKKGGKSVIKAKCLLMPQIKPGGIVKLTSSRHNGTLLVRKVTHTGDTAGGAWHTEIEGTPK